MKTKILVLIFLSLFLFVGCEPSDKRIYLEEKYYNEGKFIDITKDELDKLKDENLLIYTYNHFCNFPHPCDKVFEEIMVKYKIDVLSMSIDEYRNTEYFNKVRYAPSILIIKKGEIVAYLDANSDEDFDKYQNPEEFEKWIKLYIYTEKSD